MTAQYITTISTRKAPDTGCLIMLAPLLGMFAVAAASVVSFIT